MTDKRLPVYTDKAPRAIGTYSQAIKAGNTVYLSGQIPLDPISGELVSGEIEIEIERVIKNVFAVAHAAGGDPNSIVKLTIYMTDLSHFPVVNDVMKRHFNEPYPARAVVEVAGLPKGARIEMDAIMVVE